MSLPVLMRLAMAVAAGLAAASAHADGAACDAVAAALSKAALTPSHQTMTTTRLGKTTQGEVVTLDKVRWVFAAGKWHSRPYDKADESKEIADGLRATKPTCARVRSEAVDGEAATVYSVHNEVDGSVSDTQLWVSNARGLPLRQTIDISEGKQHIEVRFDYSHVAAPAGA